MCKSSLAGYIASLQAGLSNGIHAVPLRKLGILRPQANVLEISEQVGAPEVSVQGPSACGYVPTFTNLIPIYGKIEFLVE